jgi:hypothetical protein
LVVVANIQMGTLKAEVDFWSDNWPPLICSHRLLVSSLGICEK